MSHPHKVQLPEFGSEPVSLSARWVFPGWGAPLENGTVEITAGRISAVHGMSGPADCDLGNAAIIPGLVSAHTHLELSDVAAPLQPARPFTAWLKQVITHRRNRAANMTDELAVAAGKSEALGHGTTTIGDITGRPVGEQPGMKLGLRTVGFLEILGLAPERVSAQLQRAAEHLAGDAAMIRGLSPHAPYSVHPDLFRRVIDLAVKQRAPVATHLAETGEELELLATGTGDFVPFLDELGVWRADAIPRGSRVLDYLRELARVECGLVIHGNYLADNEIDFLAAHPNLTVVYCPRTHAYFGHGLHPWRELLARGVNLALGTDSRASNPDLSLFAELKFLRELAADFDPALLLQLGTFSGAFALGVEQETGSLSVGKSADLAIVSLPESNHNDPHGLLFDPTSCIVATICAGELRLGHQQLH